MSNIEKIRQEIERLYDGEAPKHDQQCEFEDGYFTGIATISKFIDSLPEEKQPEDLEGKQMIKELKERIVGLDNNGNPIAAAPPDLPMIVEKVNEIIRYLNEREGEHFREPTKTIEDRLADTLEEDEKTCYNCKWRWGDMCHAIRGVQLRIYDLVHPTTCKSWRGQDATQRK